MSPERMMGENHSYASDVWSTGLSILEALLGRFPYKAANSFMQQVQPDARPEIRPGIRSEPEPEPEPQPTPSLPQVTMVVDAPPPSAPDGSPPALVEFVDGCLQKDAEQRTSVAALLAGSWLSGVDDAEFGSWLGAK